MPIVETFSIDTYILRRKLLIDSIKDSYKEAERGIVILIGSFESEAAPFKQDSSFYYYTGICQPASVFMIDIEKNKTILFIHDFGSEREKWVSGHIALGKTSPQELGIDVIESLGKEMKGYRAHQFFAFQDYENVLKHLEQCVAAQKPIFTLSSSNFFQYPQQRFVLQRMMKFVIDLEKYVQDISLLVARQRRIKSRREIELMYKAADITIEAQILAAQSIASTKFEYELQALIEYGFTARGASIAFPTIIGSGKHSTILHYTNNGAALPKQGLIVIDCGADYSGYAADITRTYPINGKFNKREREIYQLVLDAQEYIASIAKPGYWLSNAEKPDHSLHHLAKKFFNERGFGEYFLHGIGHFLGLDVHDVGDPKEPLKAGDVITIEPGIYLSDEGIGVRIEDDYWVIEDGLICLSDHLPKSIDEVERLMHEKKND